MSGLEVVTDVTDLLVVVVVVVISSFEYTFQSKTVLLHQSFSQPDPHRRRHLSVWEGMS